MIKAHPHRGKKDDGWISKISHFMKCYRNDWFHESNQIIEWFEGVKEIDWLRVWAMTILVMLTNYYQYKYNDNSIFERFEESMHFEECEKRLKMMPLTSLYNALSMGI